MADLSFFDETREQSEVKSRIVSKYFLAWGNVIGPTARIHGGRIAYVDLFSGPGRYEDGTRSTPLMVLEGAIKNVNMRGMLVSLFNDRDEKNVRRLQTEIDSLPDVDTLRFKPNVVASEVGEETTRFFEERRLVPTFAFIDPWGFKGLSLDLLSSVLKDWGCDCVFFFNYNRVNAGLGNASVKEHINALFGKERAEQLRISVKFLTPAGREKAILAAMVDAVRDRGGRYVLPFRFLNSDGARPSHYLIFASKEFLGYAIMKDIMAKEGLSSPEGVPSFEFSPSTAKAPPLFTVTASIADLKTDLLRTFAGRTLSMIEVFKEHTEGTPFIKRNYKDALLQLEEEGRVKAADRPRRRKGTFADDLQVTFPKKRR